MQIEYTREYYQELLKRCSGLNLQQAMSVLERNRQTVRAYVSKSDRYKFIDGVITDCSPDKPNLSNRLLNQVGDDFLRIHSF